MPSLRIALDVEPREFELDYSGGTISLSTPDGSPVHPGIRHIANFWMKMLSLPASPASIQRLHARLVPGGTPPLAMSPIYLLMTIKSVVRRPMHFDRSAARRVGKECGSTCRAGRSPYHENKKIETTNGGRA